MWTMKLTFINYNYDIKLSLWQGTEIDPRICEISDSFRKILPISYKFSDLCTRPSGPDIGGQGHQKPGQLCLVLIRVGQDTDSAVRRRLLISLPVLYDSYLSSSPGCSGNSSGIPLQRSKSASFKLSSHSVAISTSVSIILLISEQVCKLLSGKLGQFLDLKDHYIRCVILGRYDFMIFGR